MRGGIAQNRPPRVEPGQGTAPTQPVRMGTGAGRARAAPLQLLLRTSTTSPAGFSPGASADAGRGDADGAITAVSDRLVKRTGSDAWRGWYQGICVSALGTGSYLHPCLVCRVLAMCIHLSARKGFANTSASKEDP